MQIKQVHYSTLHYVHDNFKYLTDETRKLFNWKMNDGAALRRVVFTETTGHIDGQSFLFFQFVFGVTCEMIK
ncbi:hypothetical protein T09_6267 [Trichinella sp. T9]|nr:hypothetical protein T09_6267 [Trichinella sp. T9]